VDGGAAITVIDKKVADFIGVIYTGRRRGLVGITGHKLEGEIGIVREFVIEGEVLNYERVLVVKMNENVKRVLRESGVDDSVVVGITTVESAGMIPDASTGRLRKVQVFIL